MDPLPQETIAGKAIRRLRMLSAIVEQWWCLLFGVLAACLLSRLPVTDVAYKTVMDKVMPVAISVAAILTGFQAAGQAVLLGILESGTIAFLKRTGHYKKLVTYLWRAVFLLFASSLASLIAMVFFAIDRKPPLGNSWTLATLGGLFLYAGAASYRISKLMFKILILEDGEVGRPPSCLVTPETPVPAPRTPPTPHSRSHK